MVFAVRHSSEECGQPLALYAELVNRLFSNGVSIASMGFLFAIFGGLVAIRMQDPVVVALVVLGSITAAVHVAMTIAYRRAPPPVEVEAIRAWERRYAGPGLASAIILGLCAARVFLVKDPESGILMTALVFAYASGTMARTAVRPWIGGSRVALLVISPIIALFSRGEVVLMAHGMLLAAFTVAGMETMMSLHRQSVSEISLRLAQTEKARRDPLTTLANRYAFDDYIDAEISRLDDQGGMLAVHCVDVDHFKDVNDTHGHPAGDALLQTVASRLLALARSTDFVGRLGGDEFVVVQTRLKHRAEAQDMASRIVETARAPCRIGDRDIRASVSVGVALTTSRNRDRTRLLAEADAALYASKSRGRDTSTIHAVPASEAAGSAATRGPRIRRVDGVGA